VGMDVAPMENEKLIQNFCRKTKGKIIRKIGVDDRILLNWIFKG
jgi:hypothetical protein